MKKTYIIPSVRVSTIEAQQILALSTDGGKYTGGTILGNENNMDDQEAKPWYRQ